MTFHRARLHPGYTRQFRRCAGIGAFAARDEILEGDMPSKGADVSVFIDIIGMPLTPLSFAGARRRAWWRAVWYYPLCGHGIM
jgi:hypothetical protein